MSAVLSSLARPVPSKDEVEDLLRHLDPAFLAEAGWNPGTQALAPSPDHPLLGYRIGLVRGCAGQGLVPDELCATCHSTRQRSDLTMEEFIASGPVRVKQHGEVICSVDGCPRPVRTRRLQLCYTHEHRRKHLQLPLADFLQHPRAQPLPGFGPCRVVVCTRQATCPAGTLPCARRPMVGATPRGQLSRSPTSTSGANRALRSPAVTRSCCGGWSRWSRSRSCSACRNAVVMGR